MNELRNLFCLCPYGFEGFITLSFMSQTVSVVEYVALD